MSRYDASGRGGPGASHLGTWELSLDAQSLPARREADGHLLGLAGQGDDSVAGRRDGGLQWERIELHPPHRLAGELALGNHLGTPSIQRRRAGV